MDEIKLIEIRVKLMALAERIKAKGNHSDELQTILEANLALRTLQKQYDKAMAQANRKQVQWAELSMQNSQLKKQVKALTENVQL
jgi:seryl-tRNA synthetase